MATLAQTVSATPPNPESDLWTISADLDDAIDYLQVEDEIVRVVGNFPAQYQAATATTTAPKIRVERAAGGTTAASHADGTTLTPVIPPSAGGGAAEAGTVVVSATDPGGIGWWIRSESVQGPIGPEGAFYGLFYRADELDPWARMNIGWWDDNGVLRAFIGSAGDGVDILTYDAAGIQRFQIENGGDGGSWSIVGLSADGFSTVGKVTYDEAVPELIVEVTDAAAPVGTLFINPTQASFGGVSGELINFTATGVEVMTAGTFKITSLPTADPTEAGQLWNDTGTLKVSAG